MAVLRHVFARRVLHEAIFSVHIEACVLWSNILTNPAGLKK
jgi:hypothetical protein